LIRTTSDKGVLVVLRWLAKMLRVGSLGQLEGGVVSSISCTGITSLYCIKYLHFYYQILWSSRIPDATIHMQTLKKKNIAHAHDAKAIQPTTKVGTGDPFCKANYRFMKSSLLILTIIEVVP
jgi:hypothetical protein